jgi:hypothetical protein
LLSNHTHHLPHPISLSSPISIERRDREGTDRDRHIEERHSEESETEEISRERKEGHNSAER